MAGASAELDPAGGSSIKVLFIVASRRSGSTILGNAVGELDGFFHAGELRTLWGKGLLEGRLCGCGEPVRECRFWRSVLEEAYGDPPHDGIDPTAIHLWHERAVRLRYLPRLLRSRPTLAPKGLALEAYVDAAAPLYRAVADVAGAKVIVDSSKQQADAAVLRLLPGIEAYFVHLVRDPRAVAYSWRRAKRSPGEGRSEQMMRLGSAASTRSWVIANIAAEVLTRVHGPGRSLLVRYEAFVADPRSVVEEIGELVGEPMQHLPFVGDHTVRLSTNHTAGGNPDRFKRGTVELREDNEWLVRQRRRDRLVSTALALPLLRRYGYRLAPRAQMSRDEGRRPPRPPVVPSVERGTG